MIIVTGSLVARDGRLAEALALSLAHVRRSRLENGCLSHAVHQDADNSSRLVFLEEWAGQAALAAHFAAPASRAFARAITAMAVEAPVLKVFEVTGAGG